MKSTARASRAMPKRKGDHLRMHNGALKFECLHCGAIEQLPSLIPIDAWLAWGQTFSRVHRNCQKPEKETEEKP